MASVPDLPGKIGCGQRLVFSLGTETLTLVVVNWKDITPAIHAGVFNS
jgi:hypothetical protein